MSKEEKPTIEEIFNFHNGSVRSICFSPKGECFCSVGFDKRVVIVDMSSRKKKSEFVGHKFPIWCCDYSPSGNLIATGSSDETIRLWYPESETGNSFFLQGKRPGHRGDVYTARFSHDGINLVSGGNDRKLKVWSIERKECISSLDSAKVVKEVDIKPDDRNTIISGHDGNCAELWDLRTEKSVHTFREFRSEVKCVRFHPLSSYIFGCGSGDRSIKLIDIRKKKVLDVLDVGHKDTLYTIRFHPNGKHLICGSHDETVKIIDLSEKKVLFSSKEHKNWVTSTSFSPPSSGNYFISGSWDKRIILWKSSFHYFDRKENQSKLDLEERTEYLKDCRDEEDVGYNNTFVLKIGSMRNQPIITLFSKILLTEK